jgi:protein AATF/BFR2
MRRAALLPAASRLSFASPHRPLIIFRVHSHTAHTPDYDVDDEHLGPAPLIDASDDEKLQPSSRRTAGRAAPERRRMPGTAPEVGAEYAGRRVSAAAAFGRDDVGVKATTATVAGFEGWSDEEEGGKGGSDADLTRPSPSPSPPAVNPFTAEDEDVAAMEAEYAAAEAQDGAVAAALAARAAIEAAKGAAVSAQQGVWGRALETRICLQRAVAGSNRLPRPPPLGALEGSASLKAEAAALADAAAALAAELWATADALLGAAVSSRGGGAAAPAAAALPAPEPWTPPFSGGKRSRVDWLWARGEAAMAAAAPFRDAALDRWHRKAALLSGGGGVAGGKASAAAGGVGLRALGQPPSAQVAAAMVDVARMVERACLTVDATPVRVGADVLPTRVCGAGEEESEDDGAGAAHPASTLARDPDTFDDGEFYAQLLKEYVEAAGVGPGAALMNGRGGGGAATSPHRRRKAVDRRASKGRKLRFDVHDKLVGFMAADDRGGTPPLARQLVGALFGGGRAG